MTNRARPRPHSRSERAAAPARSGTASAPAGGLLSAALLAGVSGLLVCRILVPTEGAALGDSLLIAQAWLGALLAWIWSCHHTGGLRLQVDRLDLAVWLLAGGQIVSALAVILTAGDARAAWNLLWEWFALGVTFFLVRQLFATPRARARLVGVLVALAIAMAGYGVWQRYVWSPRVAAEYSTLRLRLDELERLGQPADPREAWQRQQRVARVRQQLRQQGVTEQMLQGSGRDLFESRLKDSVEPFGRFALANTFAGFLLVWLIVLLAGIAESLRQRTAGGRWRLVALACAAGLVAYCLLLTKSRTAYVGLFAAGFAWGIGHLRGGTALTRKAVLGIAGSLTAIGLLAGIAATNGGLDRWVWAEAPKSMRYRLEYWQGTWGVIREHPWLGVGPGNFRQHYLKYKLPQSSEEIADPHNLLLDAWANGGLMGLLGLLAIGTAALALLRKESAALGVNKREAGIDAGGAIDSESRGLAPPSGNFQQAVADERRTGEFVPVDEPVRRDPIFWGSALGFGAVAASTWVGDESLWGLGAGWLLAVFVCVKCRAFEKLSVTVWGAAAIGLLVHLLGAGGIGMPAIVQTLFVLLALGTLTTGRPLHNVHITTPGGTAVATGIGLLLFLACFFTATQPVLLRQAYQSQGESAINFAQREASYRRAAAADPWSGEPWEDLATLSYQKWMGTQPSDETPFEQAVEYQREAVRRDPEGFGGYRRLGLLYQARFDKTRNPNDAREAAAWMGRAAERYPQHAEMQAELAELQAAADEHAAAREAAQRALDLDALNQQAGHRDKYLTPALRARLAGLLEPPPDASRARPP